MQFRDQAHGSHAVHCEFLCGLDKGYLQQKAETSICRNRTGSSFCSNMMRWEWNVKRDMGVCIIRGWGGPWASLIELYLL